MSIFTISCFCGWKKGFNRMRDGEATAFAHELTHNQRTHHWFWGNYWSIITDEEADSYDLYEEPI